MSNEQNVVAVNVMGPVVAKNTKKKEKPHLVEYKTLKSILNNMNPILAGHLKDQISDAYAVVIDGKYTIAIASRNTDRGIINGYGLGMAICSPTEEKFLIGKGLSYAMRRAIKALDKQWHYANSVRRKVATNKRERGCFPKSWKISQVMTLLAAPLTYKQCYFEIKKDDLVTAVKSLRARKVEDLSFRVLVGMSNNI